MIKKKNRENYMQHVLRTICRASNNIQKNQKSQQLSTKDGQYREKESEEFLNMLNLICNKRNANENYSGILFLTCQINETERKQGTLIITSDIPMGEHLEETFEAVITLSGIYPKDTTYKETHAKVSPIISLQYWLKNNET